VRRVAAVTALVGVGYAIDRQFYASSLTRSLRTFKTGLVIGLDYKINFRAHPPFANSIEDVHNRNAERIFNLLRYNGGLYLKIGQAIAMQSAILPPSFQKMFAKMFDDAPQNEWWEVEKVVREDFGKNVEDVFGVSFSHDQSWRRLREQVLVLHKSTGRASQTGEKSQSRFRSVRLHRRSAGIYGLSRSLPKPTHGGSKSQYTPSYPTSPSG
jgi:predicted unusual protein kinase regulating ubiquinone biosynthesis (AarF/ABC1/UbiB family)